MTRYITPVKIFQSNCTSAENLLIPKPRQIGHNEPCLTKITAGEYVALDFGIELNGGARIITYRGNGSKVRLRFGESISEAYSELGGERNATNDYSLRDFTVELRHQSDMTFGNTGFRFLRLDILEGEVQIKNVYATNRMLELPCIYEYRGNDLLIKDIFVAAKRTIDLCCAEEYVWDGIKKDRLVWIGDIHPEMLALTTLYGRVEKIEASLDFVKDQTPLPRWMNNFPSYSMWWIIILADYYQKTNCKDYLIKQKDYLIGLIKQISEYVDADGELSLPAYFTDWGTRGTPAEKEGVRAIAVAATKKAVWMLAALKESTVEAETLLKKLRLCPICSYGFKQVIGLKYFAGEELSQEEKDMLIANGAKGITTFMSYYIFTAIASFDKEKAIALMKEYYGAMLQKGATTFFENFNIEWMENSSTLITLPKDGEKDFHGDFGAYGHKGYRHSFCHGWAAGVITFIEENC